MYKKLHSAAATYKADKGMILTTGRFSKQAMDYATKVTDVPIELIGRGKLADLADRDHVTLLSSDKPL